MAVLTVLTLPEPILRQKSKRVRTIDGSVRKLAGDMIETMHAASGVGLAAPQVGVPLRLIVIGLPEEEDFVLINPEIVRRSGERMVTEGCLSIPGYFGEIKRAQRVTVKGKDLSGKEIRIKAEELMAQALEHEIDHINGVLYIAHLESDEKLHRIEPEVTPL
jgi:peptide deformylase